MNSRIKLSARAALTGSQKKVVPVAALLIFLFLLFSVCNGVVNLFGADRKILLAVSVVTLISAVLLISPLRLALQTRLLLLASSISVFSGRGIGLSGAVKSWLMCICLFGLKLFWLSVFEALPFLGSLILILQLKKAPISFRAACAFAIGLAALALAGFVFYLLFIQRYSKAVFYLASYRDFSVLDAINESVRRTDGIRGDILLFKLSFLPWFLLCIGILPALYVIPYYKQSVTCLFLSR